MDRESRNAALLLLVGLAALTNPLWLFPHDGEERYTYERLEVTVEDGALDYRPDHRMHRPENDLDDVACQRWEGDDRGCAFDHYLVAHGPVTVPADAARGTPAYVELGGDYYRRVATDEGSNTTYDVEPVTPREVLAEIARDVSSVERTEVGPDAPTAYRVAVTGETVTTFDQVPADELGRVYRVNGSYFTAVLTYERSVDAPLVSPPNRDLISVVGASVLVIVVVVLVLGRFVGPDT